MYMYVCMYVNVGAKAAIEISGLKGVEYVEKGEVDWLIF